MANAHTLTMSMVVNMDKWVTNLAQGSNIGWSCGTIQILCPGHSTPLSLKVHAHGVSRLSLICLPCA